MKLGIVLICFACSSLLTAGEESKISYIQYQDGDEIPGQFSFQMVDGGLMISHRHFQRLGFNQGAPVAETPFFTPCIHLITATGGWLISPGAYSYKPEFFLPVPSKGPYVLFVQDELDADGDGLAFDRDFLVMGGSDDILPDEDAKLLIEAYFEQLPSDEHGESAEVELLYRNHYDEKVFSFPKNELILRYSSFESASIRKEGFLRIYTEGDDIVIDHYATPTIGFAGLEPIHRSPDALPELFLKHGNREIHLGQDFFANKKTVRLSIDTVFSAFEQDDLSSVEIHTDPLHSEMTFETLGGSLKLFGCEAQFADEAA